jgi:hypothetical protein
MNKFALVSLAAALAGSFVAGQAVAADPVLPTIQVPGEKIDNGLGDLPHYRYWADKSGKNPVSHRIAGEKLDSGLGDIKPFSLNRTSVELAQRQ